MNKKLILAVAILGLWVLLLPGLWKQHKACAQTSFQPAFQDTFSTGALDTTKWSPTNTTYPNYAGAGNAVTFQTDHCLFNQGMLTEQLDQPTSGTSTGCELVSKQSFGYGTYECIMRASSKSTTPNGVSTTQSGQISTCFIISDGSSRTEIDSPEIEGQFPLQLEFTNWLNGANKGAALIQAAFCPQDGFHKYRFIWTPTSVTYYVDDAQVAVHITDVPTAQNPGFIDLNHYGTNFTGFGGTSSTGVTRYVYYQSMKYWTQTTGTGCSSF